MEKQTATLAQLPRSAADYYAASTRRDLFEYRFLRYDSLGRQVFQKTLLGTDYGEPRALLTYREYKKQVSDWSKLSASMGVQRWTTPTDWS